MGMVLVGDVDAMGIKWWGWYKIFYRIILYFTLFVWRTLHDHAVPPSAPKWQLNLLAIYCMLQ